MANAVEFNEDNFQELVLNSNKPVLVDFWAAWCGPCRMVGPVVEEIAGEYDGQAVVGKVDVDANQALSIEYGIRSIPALLVFKGGKVVDTVIGAVPKGTLTSKLEAAIGAEA